MRLPLKIRTTCLLGKLDKKETFSVDRIFILQFYTIFIQALSAKSKAMVLWKLSFIASSLLPHHDAFYREWHIQLATEYGGFGRHRWRGQGWPL